MRTPPMFNVLFYKKFLPFFPFYFSNTFTHGLIFFKFLPFFWLKEIKTPLFFDVRSRFISCSKFKNPAPLYLVSYFFNFKLTYSNFNNTPLLLPTPLLLSQISIFFRTRGFKNMSAFVYFVLNLKTSFFFIKKSTNPSLMKFLTKSAPLLREGHKNLLFNFNLILI